MTSQDVLNQDDLAGVVADPVGHVLSVRGSEARITLPLRWSSEAGRVTVGDFVVIGSGDDRPLGMVTEVSADFGDAVHAGRHAVARLDLMGRMTRDAVGADVFHRGVAHYPTIGDVATLITKAGLRAVYGASNARTIPVGHLHHDPDIAARIDVDNLLTKHFAVLGSTGVGKSSGVAVLLNEVLDARPDLRVFMLDGHNEYGRCFGARANVVNQRTLKLPFWMFNFDEFVDVIYGGHPGVVEELDILAELIPMAKGSYMSFKAQSNRLALKKSDPKAAGCTVDTPVPYLLQDLLGLIDERMGKLENRGLRMHYHRLTTRIETIRNDPRYGFMFDNANVGGDTMATLLTQLFRLEPDGKPITVMQLAGLPPEVVDAVVCVLARLAFDFGLWSDGRIPLLFVCEEAHRYASADRSVGFAPTRRALSRIAKEGRKYGTYLGLVTQRPAELDPTIISQCSTLFAMRMTNERDQALLRSAVNDAAANLLAFVPSLGTRELVGFGEGVPLPTRMTFRAVPHHLLPRSEAVGEPEVHSDEEVSFVQAVVDRWRGASSQRSAVKPDEAASEQAPAPEPAAASVASRLEQARYQLLRR